MFSTFIILLASVAIAYIVIPPLNKKGEKKTILVFSIILSIGAIINIAIGIKKNIPSPLDFITYIFTPLREFLLSLI
ncbi:hypothetical protein ACIQ1H_06625 [Lysinibacillus sp. NPDC097279]|uniref:hypothetical protein n=1 Tax=unclassified Lysinibacillus TaxID=2636778 RepID=UPI001172D81B|nr:hypothetical protein [Lysinibacillus sp. CD3-6]UED82465.1 hypothetical protein FH508_0011370 [Lysinibacillus sp. CD3-6]